MNRISTVGWSVLNRTVAGLGWARLAQTALSAGALVLSGCDDTVFLGTCDTPLAPVGVSSVTADEEVILSWLSPDEADAEEFVIYRSGTAYGTYHEIGHTRDWHWSDRSARNGQTYFYAVTSVNACGEESELSREIVHDTPRPEGYDARLWDAGGTNEDMAGWEFATWRVLPWDHADTDIYFVRQNGARLFVVADAETDIQDMGYADFDDVTWAPDAGWSPTGTAEVIVGHVYVVWTRDDHFAKVRVTRLDGDSVRFDWAYQTAPANPELLRTHPREGSLS